MLKQLKVSDRIIIVAIMNTMINQQRQQQQQQEQKGWREMQRTCRSNSRRLASSYIDNLFIILTILLCLIVKCIYCSPITSIISSPNSSIVATTSNESSNYIVQELDTNRQNASRRYLIAIISNQKQASERADDLSEQPQFILNNDWSERDKRMSIVSTEHSVSDNEIEGHHSTKKPAHHHHHATTENFIEIIKTIPTNTNRAKKIRSTTKKAINRRKSATTRRRRELSPHVNEEFNSIDNNYLSLSPDIEIIYPENATLRTLVTSTPTRQTTTITENVLINMHKNVTSNRQIEGGDDDDNEFDYDEEDEEGGGGVGGIIKMLLGPLSNEMGIDLDTIAALIGGLSAERDDGTYDFSGLMGLVGGLFGPGEDGKGGSDVGSFLGGILSATIGGIAGPNGAKGAGKFVGNLLTAALPGLSAPAEKAEAEPEGGAAGGSDSAGFIGGILSSIAASSSASSSGSSGDNDSASGSAGFFSKLVQVKLALLRSVFSIISGLLSSSSQG